MVRAKGQEKLCSVNTHSKFLCLSLLFRYLTLLLTNLYYPVLWINWANKPKRLVVIDIPLRRQHRGISSLMKLSPSLILRRTLWINTYSKVSGSKYIFLILYVNDILLETNDIDLLYEGKWEQIHIYMLILACRLRQINF